MLIIVAGLALGLVFVRRQLRLPDPLLDLRLFRMPAFSAALATYGLSILFLFGGFLFLPQYLQLVLGLTPLRAGLWTLPWALRLRRRVDAGADRRAADPPRVRDGGRPGGERRRVRDVHAPRRVDRLRDGSRSARSIFSLGMAPVFTLTTDIVVGSAPPERAGAASAISETSAEFGGALAIAVFGSIGVAVYRSAMADLAPAGVPPQALEAARATLGGAVAAASELPAELGAQLTDVARAAFIKGVQLGAAISTVGAIALAVFAAVSLRRVSASKA